MDIADTFTFTFVLGLACAATWLASHWWHGRRLSAALQRIDKLGQTRALYEQHMAQTRRQIDQLNRELVALRNRDRRSPAPSGAARASQAARPASAPAAVAVPPRTAVQARAAAAASLAVAAACAPAPRSLVSDLERLLEAGDLRRSALQPPAGGWQTTQPAVGNGWPVSELPVRRPPARGAGPDFADTQPM